MPSAIEPFQDREAQVGGAALEHRLHHRLGVPCCRDEMHGAPIAIGLAIPFPNEPISVNEPGILKFSHWGFDVELERVLAGAIVGYFPAQRDGSGKSERAVTAARDPRADRLITPHCQGGFDGLDRNDWHQPLLDREAAAGDHASSCKLFLVNKCLGL